MPWPGLDLSGGASLPSCDHDLTVGFGSSGGEDGDVMVADVCDPAWSPGDLVLGVPVAT